MTRPLALRRHQAKPGGGSAEHSTTELWSNQLHRLELKTVNGFGVDGPILTMEAMQGS